MKVRFWGTRGSSPCVLTQEQIPALLERLFRQATAAGVTDIEGIIDAVRGGTLPVPTTYGGHTTCVEIAGGPVPLFVDMGTGLRDAGTRYVGKSDDFIIFLTHLHWDHLQGLNFFIPIFMPNVNITFYHVHEDAEKSVQTLFNGVNFPVPYEALGAQLKFVKLDLYKEVTLGKLKVTPFALDHPGSAYGYRFNANGKSLGIGFDSEYQRINRQDMGPDLPYYQNLDLLIFDAQYELNELIAKFDWGHANSLLGVDLAFREMIRNLVLIHHDPWSGGEKLDKMLKTTKKYVNYNLRRYSENWAPVQPQGPNILMAYDGLEIDLNDL